MATTADETTTPGPGEIRGQLWEMLAGFMRTQALSVAVKLGVPDVVSADAMDIAEIARRVDAHEPSLSPRHAFRPPDRGRRGRNRAARSRSPRPLRHRRRGLLRRPASAADVYVLAQILHDWDDERARAILRNCRRSLADGGVLLLVEGILLDGPEPDFGKLFDLHMLVLVGGKERTADEWRALLREEAFELMPTGEDGLLEARPI